MLHRMFRVAFATAVSALALAFVVAVSPVAADAALATAAPAAAVSGVPLTPEEAAGLTLMREEEKLARDVYQYLYEQWGQRVFKNIAGSEQTHMNAVRISWKRCRRRK